jgi:hypothetical protein
MLCVLVAAAAGRGLVGLRNVDEEREPRPSTRLMVGVWCVLLSAAIVPNLPSLSLGLLADDFGLLRAARLADNPLDAARLLPLRIFHRPVSLLVWWLGIHLWHGSPLGYHIFSVVLHAGNTALLYVLARRYTGSMYGGAMAALLFAVHPIHVEATVWISAQPDLLCTAFCLSSMWLLEQYVSAHGRHRKHFALAGAVAAFLLALWSKETAAALLGVILVRLAVISRDRRWGRAVGVAGAYTLVLAVYAASRLFLIREDWLGGYGTQLSLQDAAFSPTPWLVTGQLLFPIHPNLFGAVLSPYLWVAAIAAMAVGLLWWILRLELVPWRQLVLYAGYLLVPTVPVATAGLTIGADMANSRYAYLPSVGVALLFGEICARRRGRRHRSKAAGAVTILVAAVLSAWYMAPWREGARLRDDLLAEGVRIVEGLPDSPPPTTVFFARVPHNRHGASVFVPDCYPMALSPLLERKVSLEEVPPTQAAWDVMCASDLLPGEHLVSWDAESRRMVLERSGGHGPPQPIPGGLP